MKIAQIKKSITEFFIQKAITPKQIQYDYIAICGIGKDIYIS